MSHGNPFYSLQGHCWNCGWLGTVYMERGMLRPVDPLLCPQCDCTKVSCEIPKADL
jgi:hypothetical protein